MSTPAVLDRAPVRPLHHLPRRDATATGVLRALGTGPVPVVPADGTGTGDRASASTGDGPRVRSLRLRDITAGGAAAAGSWTLAAHLGVLGTASGTVLASVSSAVLMAIASDSLTGGRRMLERAAEQTRRTRRHRRRR